MPTSIVPDNDNNTTVYLVLDDVTPFGHVWIEHVWSETGEEQANESTIIRWLVEEQFKRPLRVVAFNTEEGWSRDVSREIAEKLLDLNRAGTVLGAGASEFVERVIGQSARAVV
jgi:hypothetical protein